MAITPKMVLLELVLVSFLSFTGYAIWSVGYLGFFELVLSSTVSTLLFVDLSICLTLAAVWMWQDSRESGVSPLPYFIVGLLFGAAGPLAYLIHKEMKTARRSVPATA